MVFVDFKTYLYSCRIINLILSRIYTTLININKDTTIMGSFEKIAVIENEIQAQFLDAKLNELRIPHAIISYHDTALDGIFQTQQGWGHVEAPKEFRPEIHALLNDLK